MALDGQSRPRGRRIDGWRWGGRFFLLFMLLYTAVPMIWMLITSLKSGFAAMQFPPQWWPKEPTLANYQKLLDPQNSVGQDFLRFFWNRRAGYSAPRLSPGVSRPRHTADGTPAPRHGVATGRCRLAPAGTAAGFRRPACRGRAPR